jgi:hypothetical protein
MVEIAAAVVALLSRFLPYLLKGQEQAVETFADRAGGEFGGAAFEHAKNLWGRLFPRVKERPQALEAAEEVAAAPDDPDAQAALRLQIRKLLEQDEALAGELKAMLEEAQRAGVSVTASGERSVAIGGDVTGSSITTGDAQSS